MSIPAPRRSGLFGLILAVALQTAAATTALAELQLTRLIGTGDPAPGLPGITIESFRQSAAVDNEGNIAVVAVLDGPGVDPRNNRALITGRPGAFSLLLRQHGLAPGLEPNTVDFLSTNPALALNGYLAYSTTLQQTGEGIIWSGRPDDFRVVLTTQDPAPGIPDPGVTIDDTDFPLWIGPAGHVSFGWFVDGPGVNADNDGAFWSGRPGELTVRVRKGQPAPPAGAGVRFNGFFGYLEQGPEGIVFDSVLTGTGVTGSNDLAAWTESNGVLNLLAREGDAAPGLAANQVFDSFRPYQFNEAGALLAAYVRGGGIDETNDQGVWLARDGVLELLASEGDAPALDDPSVTLDFISTYPRLTMNARGDVVLLANMVGPGIDASNDRAIWVRNNEDDEWAIVAREGELVGGRVIAGLSYEDIIGYGGVGLNDHGLLVLTLAFTDGTSAKYAVPIPGPGSVWIVLAAVAVGCGRHARRPRMIP